MTRMETVGSVGILNGEEFCSTPDTGSEEPRSVLLDGSNPGNIVRVSSKTLACSCVQQCPELESEVMAQCATTLPLFSTQATTTSTGSCFIILCNTCAEQCSRFLCIHGRGGNSTSSIELDISDQGNSIVDESLPKKQSSGLSRVHSCAAQSSNGDRSGQLCCYLETKGYEKCSGYPTKPHQEASVSDIVLENLKNFDKSSVLQNFKCVKSENSTPGRRQIVLRLNGGRCEILNLCELGRFDQCFQQVQRKSHQHRKDEEENPDHAAVLNDWKFVKKVEVKGTADCEEKNQCELGGVFEASIRLKRLEEHFKGIACNKKVFKEALLEVVEKNRNFDNQKALKEICLEQLEKWTPSASICNFRNPASPPQLLFTNFQTVETGTPTLRSSFSSSANDDDDSSENTRLPVAPRSDTCKLGSVDLSVSVQNKLLYPINSLKTVRVEFGDIPGLLNENKNEHQSDVLKNHSTADCHFSDFLPDLLSTSNGISQSEFNVQHLNTFVPVQYVLECYDELVNSSLEEDSEGSCCGSLIDIPIRLKDTFNYTRMREVNGPLRGLLKKPNRPPQQRKNRVVFDETRNEFFEADYIILIREDCAYDEEDEEPCTCGEHELIRLCCEEGCHCNYPEADTRTPQSPKYAPPFEFVDEAALSPPDGYKDNGLKNAISGALSGHVFGAQHMQQLQVIQRLQQQRAAMLAARASTQQQQQGQQDSPTDEDDQSGVCSECAECVECAAKQIQDTAHNQDEMSQLSVPAVAIIPLHNNSPERRVTQKEIIAGEERPKYLLPNQLKPSQVTERRIVREATEDITTLPTSKVGAEEAVDQKTEVKGLLRKADSTPAQISGILKGGKLWKQDSQADDSNNTSSEDDSNLKRSVRFVTEANKDISREGDGKADCANAETENHVNELIPFKKHSSLFNNALRPNSAMRQLFPSAAHPPPSAAVLTHETLRAFEESKRGNPLVSSLLTCSSESDTIRRTIERNALRRSLIKKKTAKADISLEERIKQLTCNIEESTDDGSLNNIEDNEKASDGPETDRRDSPTGEENPSQVKYIPDKSFSPSSSASSSSSGSTSAYKKISNVFNREKRQEKIPETDENPIVIIPQECRCPAAPDLGMGVQVPAAHTQIHQTPPRQMEPRRQFLSTLAPLTACVAGQKDDFSYYTLASGERNSNASTQCSEYNLGDIESALINNESRKVAPDVIAGTPGQEQDELAAFANQEAIRTEKIKKRYSNESSSIPHSNASSDDDEQNDYGFNKRPSVRGIKPKFGSTNEILQQMQAQLSQPLTAQNTNKTYSVAKQPTSTNPKVQQNMQHSGPVTQHQSERSWGFYSDTEQRLGTEHVNSPNYYHAIPTAIKHTFHGHEESLTYQNCHSVTMEQHYGKYARSPTRRPESPPPLRNYHQTMVLIPYNTESYAQFSAQEPKAAQKFSSHNILEYQQVTQQTIRVPIGYTLPGMQLHVVAGRGGQPQYIHNPRVMAPRAYNFQQQDNNSPITYCERGVPEGAAATTHASDCKILMSPTGSQGNPQNGPQTSNSTSSVPETVFYAMNV